MKPTNLTLLSSVKPKELNPDPSSESSSDSTESEQGEIQGLKYWEDASNSSSSFQPSKASDDEESVDSSSPLRINILNQHQNEARGSEDDLSDSYHDSSSNDTSDTDEIMPELYDSSSDSGEEEAVDSDSEEDEPTPWHEESLEGSRIGKYVAGETAFPTYRPRNPPGPFNIPPATSFPVDFLHLYFDIYIMAIFVKSTDSFLKKMGAGQNKVPNVPNQGRYRPTSIGELYRLFGVFLHMGMKRQPSMRSYWSQDPRYSDSFVKKCFTRDRFETLKSALHLVDCDLFSKEDMISLQKNDPFWRVTPLLQHLSLKYSEYFVCHQDIDIDEMCIGFKGKHISRCYNPNKPDKWHLKAFCLNDSASGYLHRFYMYQGLTLYFFPNVPNKTRYNIF